MDIFKELPPDNFGVHVENEIDERKLLWLVNYIGEKKLRISSEKRNKYYPDSKLYISTILKWHRLKVPTYIYREQRIPIFWVYLLVLSDRSGMKIGYTGNWPGRAYGLVKTANYRLDFYENVERVFDVDKSVAFRMSDKKTALDIEKTTHRLFKTLRLDAPRRLNSILINRSGLLEWFDCSGYEEVITHLSDKGTSMSLREAIDGEELLSNDSNFQGNAC